MKPTANATGELAKLNNRDPLIINKKISIIILFDDNLSSNRNPTAGGHHPPPHLHISSNL